MRRLFSILLCLVMCFGWSLTAFAGGPMPAQDILAAESTDSAAAVTAQTALPSGLYVGNTYSIRSAANASFMLNVDSGTDKNQTPVNTWKKDGSPEQVFKIISSGSYYKLATICSTSGRVLDAYRNNYTLDDGCKVDIWDNDDDPAQQLVIEGNNTSGCTIRLASKPNLALTAMSMSNGVQVQFKTYDANNANQKWVFLEPSFSLSSAPDPNCQNKENWCWAAAAKIVGVHNGGLDPVVDKATQMLTDTYGVHKPYYRSAVFSGKTRYFVDGVQHSIVEEMHHNDEDLTGTADKLIYNKNGGYKYSENISGSMNAFYYCRDPK